MVAKRPLKAARKPAAEPARPSAWKTAVTAAGAKQAQDMRVFDLREMGGFTDFLVICHGTNPRQVQAISDEIEKQLKAAGERALSIEGYTHAEWILMDYGDFVVNVFTDKARAYYDLERLWRDAKAIAV